MFSTLGRSLAAIGVAMVLALSPATRAAEGGEGILLLAHGSHAHHGHGHHAPASVWNANVEDLARSLDTRRPTEVAFGMADSQAIQAAVDRLESRGVKEIAVIPLFISSHSPIIGNSRYILGLQPELAKTTRLRHLDRVSSAAEFRFAGAIDAHPLVSEILLERARAVTDDPAATRVVLIAHGPNDEDENRLWLRDMEAHGRFLRERGGFPAVDVLTHRNDAPAPVKAEARAAFRQRVADAGRTGTVVVVPVLLSAGGIEAQLQADLEGLAYRFAQPLMPHPNIERWVEAQVAALRENAVRPTE
jgi:sirohydrochlorin ferrochelatase